MRLGSRAVPKLSDMRADSFLQFVNAIEVQKIDFPQGAKSIKSISIKVQRTCASQSNQGTFQLFSILVTFLIETRGKCDSTGTVSETPL